MSPHSRSGLLGPMTTRARWRPTINALNSRLGHIAVIPVTGTPGPALTHLPLTAGVGLTRYDESYADITGLQPVARWRLVRRRGLLTQGELGHIENGVRTYLGL